METPDLRGPRFRSPYVGRSPYIARLCQRCMRWIFFSFFSLFLVLSYGPWILSIDFQSTLYPFLSFLAVPPCILIYHFY
jgi:hypothetical protein